jgi:hypothetical protein
MMRSRIPELDRVGPDTPLRLDMAARLAFPPLPNGKPSMTASGLRREAARGRLAVERIAGKDFTTLEAIANMRALCRLAQVPQGSISASDETGQTPGSSSIADARSAQAHLRMTAERLKKPLKITSDKSTAPVSATVIPLASR